MKKKIAFSLIAIVLFFVLIEAAGQAVYYLTHDRTPLWKVRAHYRTDTVFTPYGLVDYPPRSGVYRPDTGPGLDSDRYGFVHNGEDTAITDDDVLIFLLGGSTVEGRGASSNKTTAAAYLERILNQINHLDPAGKPHAIRVVNAGVCGHQSYQELNVLMGKILQNFKPDMVVALDGRNDGHYAISFADHGWKPNWQPYYSELTETVNRLIQGKLWFTPMAKVKQLSNCSFVFASLMKAYNKMKPAAGAGFPQQTPPSEAAMKWAAQAYYENHALMKNLCDLKGIRYAVFLQPTLLDSQKESLTPAEKSAMDRFAAEHKNPQIYYPALETYYQFVREQTKGKPWFRDLTPIFKREKVEMYVDSVHYNDTGNEMIAARMAELIQNDVEAAIQRKKDQTK